MRSVASECERDTKLQNRDLLSNLMRSSKAGRTPDTRLTRLVLAVALLAGPACGARLDDRELLAARRRASGAGAGAATTSTGGAAASGAAAGGGEAASPTPVSGTASPQTSGAAATSSAAVGGRAAGGTGPGAGGGGAAATTAGGTAGAPACAADVSSSDPGVSAKEIHFGNVSTTGGPVPGIFKAARDGVNAYFAYVNSQGGVCGRQLKLDSLDDNLDASQNQHAYEQLVTKTLGIVGGFSPVDEGGGQVLQEHADMPDVAFTAAKSRLDNPNNFSPQPLRFPGWRLGPLKYYKQTFGDAVVKKMAMFTEDVQVAKDASSSEVAAARSLGYEFVYSRVTEPTDADFTSDVSNMKNKGVKGVMMLGDVGQIARIAAAMKAQNFTVPFANWSSNAYDQSFIQQSQGGSEGALLDLQEALFLGEDAAAVPEVALLGQWMRRVGGKPDLYAAYSWASARMMISALQQAGGKPTRAGIMTALKTVHRFDSNGLLAPADPAGKVPPTCYVFVRVKNAKFVRDASTPAGYRCEPGGYFG